MVEGGGEGVLVCVLNRVWVRVELISYELWITKTTFSVPTSDRISWWLVTLGPNSFSPPVFYCSLQLSSHHFSCQSLKPSIQTTSSTWIPEQLSSTYYLLQLSSSTISRSTRYPPPLSLTHCICHPTCSRHRPPTAAGNLHTHLTSAVIHLYPIAAVILYPISNCSCSVPVPHYIRNFRIFRLDLIQLG